MSIQKKTISRGMYLEKFGYMPSFNISVDFNEEISKITAQYKLYQDRNITIQDDIDKYLNDEIEKAKSKFNYIFKSVYKKMLEEKSVFRCLMNKDYACKMNFLEHNIDKIEEQMTSDESLKNELHRFKIERENYLNEEICVPDLNLNVGDFVWCVVINQSLNINNTDEYAALCLHKYEVSKITLLDGKFQGVSYNPNYKLKRVDEDSGSFGNSYEEIDFDLISNINENEFQINQRYNKIKICLNEADAKTEYQKIRKNIIEKI